MFTASKLSVFTDRDIYFIYPPTDIMVESDLGSSPPESEAETVVNGYVRLVLPRKRALGHLTVKLETTYSVNHLTSSHPETGVLYSKQYNLDLQNRVFCAGASEFRFSFVLPRTNPATHRSDTSTIETKISARLTTPRRTSKTLRAEKMINCVTISRPNELPDGIAIMMDEASPSLGPYRVEIVSDSATVGSLVNFRLFFDQPVYNCQIKQIQCRIEMSQSVHGKVILSAPTNIFRVGEIANGALMNLPPSPLPLLQKGKCAEFAITSRMPTDQYLMPSTHLSTRSPLQIRHQMVLTILYSIEGEAKDRLLKLSRTVQIASCSCMSDSILLPAYKATEEKKKPTDQPSCVCGYAFSALVEASTLAQTWSSMSATSGLMGKQKQVVMVGEYVVMSCSSGGKV